VFGPKHGEPPFLPTTYRKEAPADHRPPNPPALSRIKPNVNFPNPPPTLEQLHDELSTLNRLQSEALQAAPYDLMPKSEKEAYDRRRAHIERITGLLAASSPSAPPNQPPTEIPAAQAATLVKAN
jgi:hypothetical protein